jgi:anti-sigma B factor antagonist
MHVSGPAETFSAKVIGLEGDSLLVLAGELDLATAPELAGVIDQLVAQGPRDVALDLSGLSFIDSSGIAVLVDAQHRLTEQGRHLSIRAARRSALRVFEIAGLVEFLDVQPEIVAETSGH